ncbi:MAG: orc1/cdc6 family replication initiation protein [Nanoarchaeota archaeon]|nr:orc1/cdc6 family replication initiation protein [Nanoarchaeota archaeon]
MTETEKTSAKDLLLTKLYRKKTIIKNPVAFRPEYLPQDLFVREEIDSLFDDLTDYIKYNTPGNILLLGRPGTGKTASLKFLDKTLGNNSSILKDFSVKYINCRNKTAFDIMSELTANMKSNINIKILFEHFFLNLQKNYILFLDEIDTPKNQKEVEDLLFVLSRPSEYANEFEVNHTIKLVLASNSLKWSGKIDVAVASSLLLKTHIFQPYNIKQLVEILERRCREGLSNQSYVTKEILRNIAQKTISEYHGDARAAIKILFYAAKDVEKEGSEKIIGENIDKVSKFVEKEIESEGVIKLNDAAFLILYSSVNSKIKETTGVYDIYGKISINCKLKPVKYTNFHHYLQYLENQNLIQLYKNKNVKTKTLTIEVVVPPEIVKEEFERRKMRLFLEKKENQSWSFDQKKVWA